MAADRARGPSYAEALERVCAVYRALDASDGPALARHFTPDALWHRPDGTLTGREAIEAMADARDPTRITAHVVGNLAVEAEGDAWIARYYLTVFVGQDGKGQWLSVLACEDRLAETTDGWRVAEKRSRPMLRA